MSSPSDCTSSAGSAAASAPMAMATAQRRPGTSTPSGRFARQAVLSHSSTAGTATAEVEAKRSDQASKSAATNSVPRPTAASTASSVRSTTPAWQTSNTEAGPRRAAPASPGISVSSSVLPKPVLRASAAVWALRALGSVCIG